VEEEGNEMTLEGPRILDKTLGFLDVVIGPNPGSPAPDLRFPAALTGAGWEVLDPGLPVGSGSPTYVNRSYYDLSGYAMDSITSFIQGVDIQEGFGPRGTVACYIVDLITTDFIEDQELIDAYVYTTGNGDLPGFPLSTTDMQQVIYGRTRCFTTSTSWGDLVVQSVAAFGTGVATTAQKLYITRVVYPLNTSAQNQNLHVPPCNYVCSAVMAKEEDLSYIQRQKLSYEQTNSAG